MSKKYKMTISRLSVDKLGVKLYDRVSAVMAEIVANSYDADATVVTITAPMGQLLARKSQGQIHDQGFSIEVSDNGSGMLSNDTVNELNDFYLKVGSERRKDSRRGEVSKEHGRKVMGRKGVGKLAPFGVCQKIEVITAGGEKMAGVGENGNASEGYLVSHLFLARDEILQETDKEYYPHVGTADGKVKASRGTLIRMTGFDHRWVPEIADFERQMAQRFGVASAKWKIVLRDSQRKAGDPDFERIVGSFALAEKPGTKIEFRRRAGAVEDSRNETDYSVAAPNATNLDGLKAGFEHEGAFYPLTGWIAYSDKPYKDQLMAGVRIYCRGKIAAQTMLFNRGAGFTGEFDVRSYLIGELCADWLDESEDLIRTDRQDILWSHDLGQGLEKWGQDLVVRMGRITREPMRRSAWEKFREESKIEERVEKAFPGVANKQIREQTIEIAEKIAKTARGDELNDEETRESFVQLSLLLGPHITLDRKLKEAAEMENSPMAVVSAVLKTARLAELASFGRIADDRVRVIETLEKLKGANDTDESDFQKLLSEAPWLINPQWSPITANQSFETLRKQLAIFYKHRKNADLALEPFSNPKKRADFVLQSQDNMLRIIEIKRPGHALENEEMDRIVVYHDLMRDFLAANKEFRALFPKFEITLVCDALNLNGSQRAAFEGYEEKKVLEHINWTDFLVRTSRMHQGFLNEAERQRKLAAGAQ